MSKNSSDEKWLTVEEAAQKLNVSMLTVQHWAKVGRLKAKPKQVTRIVYMIAADSLKDAKKAKCLVCGKVFSAKHPRRAKFCSTQHRMAFHYRGTYLKLQQAAK